MPIFEFRCDCCETGFELLVRLSEAVIVCPECKSDKVKKAFSTFAAQGASRGKSVGGDSGSAPHSGCCGGGCGGSH